MRKAYYAIGRINQWASLRFSIMLRNKENEFCVGVTPNGDGSVHNLYPSLTLTIVDEIRDGNARWSLDKTVSFSRFTGQRFVDAGRGFIQKFAEKTELFQYISGELTVNTDLAKEISFRANAEFERKIMVIPVVGKDLQMNQRYEGVAMFISNLSNYVVFTYDEFISLVDYLDGFDYDGMALKLLGVILSMDSAKNLEQSAVVSEPKEETNVTKWVDRPNTIPDLK